MYLYLHIYIYTYIQINKFVVYLQYQNISILRKVQENIKIKIIHLQSTGKLLGLRVLRVSVTSALPKLSVQIYTEC